VALTYPGLLNFRDVGGAPVSEGGRIRRGVLYRSASPYEFEPGALAASSVGLRAIVDLRDKSELLAWPYELDDPSIERVNIAVLDDRPVPPDQVGLYAHMAESCGAAFTAAVRAVARVVPDPVLVHCAVGKDRTGFTVALALAAVGVSQEAILADYVLSNAGLGIAEPEPDVDPERDADGNYLTGRYVAPGLIADSLARARALGGDVPGYLAAHGMTGDELARLRAGLVGPGAEAGAEAEADVAGAW
jgi:protein-tyrosine phosphatase